MARHKCRHENTCVKMRVVCSNLNTNMGSKANTIGRVYVLTHRARVTSILPLIDYCMLCTTMTLEMTTRVI